MALPVGPESVTLPCDPPLDFPAALTYLAPRATHGVEAVTHDGRYARTVRILDRIGWISVGASTDGRHLAVHTSRELVPVRAEVAVRVRRLFDLDTDPRPIAAHLGRDPRLAGLVARRPRLRLVCAMDGFELAVRAVLGQGVTVRGASLLAARLVALAGEPLRNAPLGLTHLPITADGLVRLAPGRLRSIGLPHSRTSGLLALARATAAGELPELVSGDASADPAGFIERISRVPGIGPWTAHYVAMRALGWPDAFPEADLGLRKAMGGVPARDLRAAAERWRPWRAYAAFHLWTDSARPTG